MAYLFSLGTGRGVTPVVGTIFAVAIVVILASIAGAYFIGLTDMINEPAPVVAQSTGELSPNVDEDGNALPDGGIVRIEHLGGDSIDAANIEVIVDTGDSCGQSGRIINLPSDFTGFAAVEGYGDENFEENPSIFSKSDYPKTWSPGVLHESNSNTFSSGSQFEFRINKGDCELQRNDKITVRIVHLPSDASILTQDLQA